LDAEIAALVENVQREDLRPHELARALKRLKDAGLSYEEIGKRTAKSESWIQNLVGFEEEASPALKRAVERYYEEPRLPSGELTSVQKSSLPAVPIKVGVTIKQATHSLPKIQAQVIQQKFAESISKHDLSLPEAERALGVWRRTERKISPEKAVRIVVREREKEQEKAADVVWVQFDKGMQEGVKVVMARENLPSVRDTVVYLVRYALEELDVIPSHR
jgi:ParB-like chromosome segregation protein Spo0J